MYRVELSSQAKKGYEAYTIYREKIDCVLETLETNPYPFHDFDLVKLKGLQEAYRIRIGKMRVKYKIIQKQGVILVYYIGQREGAYD